MANQGVGQKPSKTALFAALRRTLANKEYRGGRFGPDDLAEIFLPAHLRFLLKFEWIRANAIKKLDDALPGLGEYMIARTACFDDHFVEALKSGISQIVLLGAGYDSRPYRFADLNLGARIFELDIYPTQHRKRKCLKKAGIDIPSHVEFVPVDFNEETLEGALEHVGYSFQDKTLFIWEGVTYYLDAQSVEETLAFFRDSSHKESAMVFDYITSIPDEKIEDSYGVRKFMQAMREHHANEALVFSLAEGKIESFLEERGLKIIEHLSNREIESRYLIGEKGVLLGQMTGHFRFVWLQKAAALRGEAPHTSV